MDGSIFLYMLLLFGVVCILVTFIDLWQEIKNLRKGNDDLLNRLMAKSYVEYAQVEAQKEIGHSVAAAERKMKSIMEETDVFQVN